MLAKHFTSMGASGSVEEVEGRCDMFSLTKRQPARTEREMARRGMEPLWSLRDELDTFFDRFMEGWRFPEEWSEMRDWNVEETDNEVVMKVELPGFDAKEIQIRL